MQPWGTDQERRVESGPSAQSGHLTMGFQRKGRFLGVEMEGGGHLGQRKTCMYKKWEIIYLSAKECVQSAFPEEAGCNVQEAWRDRHLWWIMLCALQDA